MLDQLLAYLEQHHDDDPFVSLDSLVLNGRDAKLTLRVMDYQAQEGWRTWDVGARGLRDFSLREPHGGLAVHADHVLARQHTDRRAQLSFRGRPQSATELVGHLYLAHRELTADWIPFHRYLNNLCNLDELLDGGYGTLADGPQFLMTAYALVLEASGVSPSLLPPRPATWFDGSAWIEMDAQLTTLLIGESSFLVAVEFEETPG